MDKDSGHWYSSTLNCCTFKNEVLLWSIRSPELVWESLSLTYWIVFECVHSRTILTLPLSRHRVLRFVVSERLIRVSSTRLSYTLRCPWLQSLLHQVQLCDEISGLRGNKGRTINIKVLIVVEGVLLIPNIHVHGCKVLMRTSQVHNMSILITHINTLNKRLIHLIHPMLVLCRDKEDGDGYLCEPAWR